MPNKPSKEFWDKHYKEVKEANPGYSDERVSRIVANMWYHKIGPKAKSKYEKIRKRREGKLEKGMLDAKHIISDMKEFDEISDKAKDIKDIAEDMKEEDKQALKKKKKDIAKSVHFIEIDADTEIPEGLEAIDIYGKE